MRRYLRMIRAVSLVFAATLSYPDAAQAAPSIVFPTGTFPTDSTNVQQAINRGGDVLLRAVNRDGTPTAFNFGPATSLGGFVFPTVDVSITGESANGHMTTINGGNTPILVLRPLRIAITGINFAGPRANAIFIGASLDAAVVGNTITDVVGVDQGGFTFGRGIQVGNGPQPSAISGRMLIALNVIDGIHAQAGYGISVSNLAAQVTIMANSVSGVDLNGILVGVNSSTASIIGNRVVPGLGENPDFSVGNGIFVGHARGGTYDISGNQVICDNPFADGIAIIGSSDLPVVGSIISDNDVTMHGSLFGAISLYDTVSEVTIKDNEIRGDGAYALQIGLFASAIPVSAAGNTFGSNDVSALDASVADIFLDINAANTVLCDQQGSLVDRGVRTQIRSTCD